MGLRGSLLWNEGDLAEHRTLGPDERLLEAAGIARLEPRLKLPPARAVRLDSDGAIDPVAVIEALVRAAQEHGARLMASTAVAALRVRDGTVVGVDTPSGFLPSRTVVVTAGAEAPVLCAPLGFDLPVTRSPPLLLRFTAPPGQVRTLCNGPELEEVREASDGELWVAAGAPGRRQHERPGQDGAGGARAVDSRLRRRAGHPRGQRAGRSPAHSGRLTAGHRTCAPSDRG